MKPWMDSLRKSLTPRRCILSLPGFHEAELLVLAFRFRPRLFQRDTADDVDQVEFDGVIRRRRLGKCEGGRNGVASVFAMVIPTT